MKRYPSRNTIVLIASIVALIGWGYGVYQWRQYTECQARVTDTVIQVLDARSIASDQEQFAEARADTAFREAMNVLLARPPRPAEEVRRALAGLQRALDEQERERENATKVRLAHPIPELPSQSC